MSVVRTDLTACIGCGTCANICPLDVFYMDHENQKSVMLYPENCQSCGQCYLHCPTQSLGMQTAMYGFTITSGRGLRTFTEVMPAAEEKSWA